MKFYHSHHWIICYLFASYHVHKQVYMHDPTQHPFTAFAGNTRNNSILINKLFDNNDPVPIIVLFGILLLSKGTASTNPYVIPDNDRL